jgi:hypothetical protein
MSHWSRGIRVGYAHPQSGQQSEFAMTQVRPPPIPMTAFHWHPPQTVPLSGQQHSGRGVVVVVQVSGQHG